ncbi:RNA polymerase-associated protein RapA [Candidatus Xiphinematobacter sp. Idaho Grape]|uniref:DEAD/DEAH box helicase n=1 Tax=Candidatus Xiphinematobacter sp. Idaho Grape TaxID=1704307 RepID=UPI00070678BF|nr:DEAD/DEAH box helicase [Candidatus Xiphinematobacter sp. Idaho Grape]ALJ56796.1 RNA polymerase-associated protein RapA [Candidatus Xiphinematobacter sp. Idaho Grape]
MTPPKYLPVELTEKILMSMGGAQVFLKARRLCADSLISEVAYEPPMLKGKIKIRGRRFFSGLLVRSSVDVDNLCSCKESRLYGTICEHSVAIGLSLLLPSIPATLPTSTPLSSPESEEDEDVKSEFPQVELFLEGSLHHMEVQLRFHYSQPGCRNPAAENTVFAELCAWGFEHGRGYMHLRGEGAILNFYAAGLPKLRSKWKIIEGTRWSRIAANLVSIEPHFAICKHASGWLDFHIHYTAGTEAIFSQADMQKLLVRGRSYIHLKSGSIATLNVPELTDIEEVLRDCNPVQRGGVWHIPAMFAPYLQDSTAMWSGISPTISPVDDTLRLGNLGSMKGRLRPYQIRGVQWLLERSRAGLGGLLADEMGLGKTVQILAMLESIGGPALVVCPSSLVWNWEREAKQFFPELRVATISGPKRAALFSRILEYGLSITSYALLRRDIDQYRNIEFSVIILDEGQHIKSPESQNAKAVYTLRAQSRFILTGTPIENSIQDLWALFRFLLPGYLGPLQSFRDRYEIPLLEEEGRDDIARRLFRRIQPYVLRRLKQEVLDDLPDKIEKVAEVELSRNQKEAYVAFQLAARRKIDALMKKSDSDAARMLTLTALLRLRQLCCDLRLIHPEARESSSKIAALLELMQEVIGGNHRVLVFSQFTSMLDLIALALDGEKIRYCRLDGTTRDRKNVVDRFQEDCSLTVFLISLKAGGVGLNLTAADTVIHFDPWWNPAIEEQATARAHRIGQRHTVTSIKLIARNTVEERILRMQQAKKELLSGVLDLEGALNRLSLIELRELIA